MQLQERKLSYLDEEHIFSFQTSPTEDISFKMFVTCYTDKFLQFQKDILEEFVADFSTAISAADEVDIHEVKTFFEGSLQVLNTKLKQFAEKVSNVDKFQIKGTIQLVMDTALMASMIGDTTLMILRDSKVLYTLTNSVDSRSKIDLFSDFIEGSVEQGDQIFYLGTKISDVMDAHDTKEMERLLGDEGDTDSIISFLEDILTTRIDKTDLGFILSYALSSDILRNIGRGASRVRSGLKSARGRGGKGIAKQVLSHTGAQLDALSHKFHNSESIQKIKKQFLLQRYYVVALVLGLLIIFMITALATQWTNKQDPDNKFQTSSGVYIDVTLDGIQQAMAEFQQLDVGDKLKSDKYNEIKKQLAYLEEKGKWLEDVKVLRDRLEIEYYEGFNIILVNDLRDFDDVANGKETSLFTLTEAQIKQLGSPHSIYVPGNIMIAGDKGAIINTNAGNPGTTVAYNAGKSLSDCNLSLSKNGLYCYNTDGDIYLISKSGITPVTTSDGDFKTNIGGVGTFGRNNLYVFQKNLSNLGSSLVTRYRNTAGSDDTFQGGTSYSVDLGSGVSFGDFSSFTIDGSFLGWNNGKPYLFWRPDTAGSKLSYREIDIIGGDTASQSFSQNVKILTFANTRYIYLFDRDNQTFGVYDTASIKTNDANKATYKMKYLFSFKFQLANGKILDVAIPESSTDKPELYLLSDSQVNKINLSDFIDSVKNNNKIKTLH
ncbi:hypothetical protein AGMMS50249_6270 [candidate division SR1 bacterium]|nr:hypothetical protein AGMMS50249_6270 [candidate division SR1 bacterium]